MSHHLEVSRFFSGPRDDLRPTELANIVYVRYSVNRTEPRAGEPRAGTAAHERASGLRAAHVEETRRALLDAAREVFTSNGYRATRTEEIVQRAGLTRGALYHHFRDKEDLFRAVYEEVAGAVDRQLRRRSGDHQPDAWSLFRLNSEVYLDAASSDPAYRQIVLIDGPAVFGWDSMSRRTDGPTRKIVDYVADAIEEGSIDSQPVEPLAHLLSALGVSSAMYVAHAEDPAAARREISECNDRLLAGLRSTSPKRSRRAATKGP